MANISHNRLAPPSLSIPPSALSLFNIGGRKKGTGNPLTPCSFPRVMYDALSNFGIPALSLLAAPFVNLTKFERGGEEGTALCCEMGSYLAFEDKQTS